MGKMHQVRCAVQSIFDLFSSPVIDHVLTLALIAEDTKCLEIVVPVLVPFRLGVDVIQREFGLVRLRAVETTVAVALENSLAF